jgi:chromosome segregation protein
LGVPAGSGAVVLARRRKAKQLRQECEVANQAENNARDLMAKAEQRLQASKEQHSEKSAALVLVRAQMRDAEKAKREATHEHSVLLKERVRQQRLSEEITTEMNAVLTARASLRLRQEQVEKEVKDCEALADEVAKQARDKIWNERTAKEQLVVGLKERVNGLNRSIGEIVTTIERTTVQVQNGNTEIGDGHARIEELRKDDVRLAEKLQTLGETQSNLRERLETERLQVLKERERVTERETVVEQAREAHKEAEKAKSELEHALVETRAEIGRVREQVSDKHDVSVAGMLDRVERVGHYTVEVDPTARGEGIIGVAPPKGRDAELIQELRITRSMLESETEIEKWVAELTTLRAETERLGEVNLVAMLEYQEVAERHEALAAQEADLMESIASIRKTIAELNKTCRERFRETYDLVNEYFSEGYPRLVGGGSACIQLTDEEDLLEAGVEIFVQPPGKRLQTLSLLSGGETAMVAIAFIFALFRVKPSPFCLLDEVDAPLDEGNGIRFNSMLREMSELAQFIVITHNKKTMECADTLYGVTMPIPGVSRLVTVRLD